MNTMNTRSSSATATLALSRNYYYALLRCLTELRDDLLEIDLNVDDLTGLIADITSATKRNEKSDQFILTMDLILSHRIYCALFEYVLTLPYWEPSLTLMEKFEEVRSALLEARKKAGGSSA